VILSVNYIAVNAIKIAYNNVPRLIESTYTLHHKQLIQKLKNALSWVHFSVDMWTSPAKTGYQVIIVHWADAKSQKVEITLLSLKEFKGSHGGEEQARTFLEVIKEAGLQSVLGFFTSDNHGSNDKMLRFIAHDETVTNFKPKVRRVRCFGHNLNLVAQAFLFGLTRQRGEARDNEDEAIELAIREIEELQRDANEDRRSKEDIAAAYRKFGVLGKVHNQNIFSRASTERY
jgi:hypothetical protein